MNRLSSLRLIATLAVLAVGALSAPAGAGAAFSIKQFDLSFANQDGSPVVKAGEVPFALSTELSVNTRPGGPFGELPGEEVKTLRVDLPTGFAGTPDATPKCSTADFLANEAGLAATARSSLCPDSTAIGTISAGVEKPGFYYHAPVFNLEPDPGTVAKFGFVVMTVPVAIESRLSETAPYHVVSEIENISQTLSFFGSKLTLWGNPADPAHDPYRGKCVAVFEQDKSTATPSRGVCPIEAESQPFLTMPRTCDSPLAAGYAIDTWQLPGSIHTGAITTSPGQMSECDQLGFTPNISAHGTNSQASSPTGLEFEISNDFDSPQSDLKKSVVTLPEGFALNPAAAAGLAACTPADLARERADSEPGDGCPQAAKVGTLETQTPLLVGKTLTGSIYVAQPDDPSTPQPGAENPFDSTFAIYLVVKNRELGISVKLPGKVEPDPATGRLVTTFDDLPQVPISNVRLQFRSGARAPLVTPGSCGSYQVKAELTPWANPSQVVTRNTSVTVGAGASGGSCLSSARFDPTFEGGSISNGAGTYSPFFMRVTRDDGDQELTRLSALLPPGVTGKLAGISSCSDLAMAAAGSKTGRAEIASPSCPADSLIGHIQAGAGAGPELSFVSGSLYLGGPYQGEPLSVIAIVPAVSGPFDLGNVVVRQALAVDPETAQVTADGTRSQPFPRILEGVPLALRDLRLAMDRDRFMLNPTGCRESRLRGTLFSGGGLSVDRSVRFQAAACDELGYKPRLSLNLKGGTRRGSNPALKAVLRTRAGDANTARAAVTLPHALFLDQAHIGTVCTRVQLAAASCPKRSVYGFARAKTPLLDGELAGPVYLVSSNHDLPDLLADLQGRVDVRLRGVISSKNGGIRTVFASTPDVPVTSFTLSMKGGKKSLLVASRNLCSKPAKADVAFTGHNGKRHEFRQPLVYKCGKGKAKGRSGSGKSG